VGSKLLYWGNDEFFKPDQGIQLRIKGQSDSSGASEYTCAKHKAHFVMRTGKDAL
jgi:hypothetical protein